MALQIKVTCDQRLECLLPIGGLCTQVSLYDCFFFLILTPNHQSLCYIPSDQSAQNAIVYSSILLFSRIYLFIMDI